jgi:two-component system, NtrC family, response regulator AtoC
MISAGAFREDLFYRINVLFVRLPALRERPMCIEPLAVSLLSKISRSLGKRIDGLSPKVIELMKLSSWPGNIRQLANTIERAAILTENPVIHEDSLPAMEPAFEVTAPLSPGPQPFSLAMQEKDAIVKVLEDCLWIQKDAAQCLGISPRALNYKIKKFGIAHPRWRKNRG